MKVIKNGKTLWHVQNMNICSDGEPYDLFLWSEKFPTKKQLKQALTDDMDDCTRNEIDEWLTSSEIYPVYASNKE